MGENRDRNTGREIQKYWAEIQKYRGRKTETMGQKYRNNGAKIQKNWDINTEMLTPAVREKEIGSSKRKKE